MWLPHDIIRAVDDVARLSYVNRHHCKTWNTHRREGELRLLTGWAWTAKDGSDSRQGFKTRTACYRDCWYYLVQGASAPSLRQPRLRLVKTA